MSVRDGSKVALQSGQKGHAAIGPEAHGGNFAVVHHAGTLPGLNFRQVGHKARGVRQAHMHAARGPGQGQDAVRIHGQAVHGAAVGENLNLTARQMIKPVEARGGRALVIERAVQKIGFRQIVGVKEAVQPFHAKPAIPPHQKPGLVVGRAGHGGHVLKASVRVMAVPAHDFLLRHVGEPGQGAVGQCAPDHGAGFLLISPDRYGGVAQHVPGQKGHVLAEIFVRAVVVGELAHGLAAALEVEHAAAHGNGRGRVVAAVGGLHFKADIGGGQGHALAGGKRPLAALGAEGQGLAVGLQPDDAVGLGGGQGGLDGVIILGRRGRGHDLEIPGARKPDGNGPVGGGGPAQALLVKEDL